MSSNQFSAIDSTGLIPIIKTNFKFIEEVLLPACFARKLTASNTAWQMETVSAHALHNPGLINMATSIPDFLI